MKNLNYHHLMYFRVVAKFGSFSRAAQELKVGQPALSMQIKHLEESLGCALFERKKKGLELTEEGRRILKYAESIYQSGIDLLDSLHGGAAPTENFRLGCMESVPKSLVASLCAKLVKDPSQNLIVKENQYLGLVRELQAMNIHAAICEEPPFRDMDLRSKRFASFSVSLCGIKKFENLKEGFPQSLHRAPIIMPAVGTKLRIQLEHFFEVRKIRPRFIVETFDTALQKLLAREGVGMVPLSEPSSVEFLGLNGGIEVAKLPGIRKELWILYRHTRFRHKLLDSMLEMASKS